MRFGLVRLMGLLGYRYRHFPTAAWLESGRPDVTTPEAMAASVLARVSWIRVSSCRAYLRGIETQREARPPTGPLDNDVVKFARQEVVLEISAREADAVSRHLLERGHASPLALLTCPDREADASLVWVPGASEWNAITTQGGTGNRMTGNHVIIIAEQVSDEVKIVEDGFGVLVTNSTWTEICQRLASPPQNWGMPISDGIGFRLKVAWERRRRSIS
jgi:hypothetical protein